MLVANIAGASGYAGAELIRLIQGHQNLQIGALSAAANAGERLSTIHSQFLASEIGNLQLQSTEADLLKDCDVLFLALPHGASAQLVKSLPSELPIVDLGADYRLARAADWNHYYGGQHAGSWIYGLPEIPGLREKIRNTHRVANPGCYATAIALGLAPLIKNNFVNNSNITVVAASGTSGAGRNAKVNLLASEVAGSISAYKVGGIHQHTPEIEQTLNSINESNDVRITFTPLLAPMSRGIHATITAQKISEFTAEQIRSTFTSHYKGEYFVKVTEPGVQVASGSVLGSNFVQISMEIDERVGNVVVTVVLDNLVKGAAGQAIQNCNLMMGFEETLGLTGIGVAP